MAEVARAMEAMGLLAAEPMMETADETEVVEISVRVAVPPALTMSFQPPTKTVSLPRRRLITTFYYDHPSPVKMRHSRPDLDNSIADFQLT